MLCLYGLKFGLLIDMGYAKEKEIRQHLLFLNLLRKKYPHAPKLWHYIMELPRSTFLTYTEYNGLTGTPQVPLCQVAALICVCVCVWGCRREWNWAVTMFCGSLGCMWETKSDSVCVGVSDRAGGCLAHTSHQQKASVFVKCFSQQYAYLKWVKGKTELWIHFFWFYSALFTTQWCSVESLNTELQCLKSVSEMVEMKCLLHAYRSHKLFKPRLCTF